MNSGLWWTIGLTGYALLFLFVVGGLLLLQSKRRRERPPERFKLLRGPGESLRRRVQAFDDNLIFWLGGAALLPLLVASSLLLTLSGVSRDFVWLQLTASSSCWSEGSGSWARFSTGGRDGGVMISSATSGSAP